MAEQTTALLDRGAKRTLSLRSPLLLFLLAVAAVAAVATIWGASSQEGNVELYAGEEEAEEAIPRGMVLRQIAKARGLRAQDMKAEHLEMLEEICDEKTDSTGMCGFKKKCGALPTKQNCRDQEAFEGGPEGVKPCWWAFGKCKLKNFYGGGPEPRRAKPGDKKDLLDKAGNLTKGDLVDAEAVNKVLDGLFPPLHSHLKLWSWRKGQWLHHRYNAWTIARWKRRHMYYKQWYWAYGPWGRYRTYRWARRGKPEQYKPAEAKNATADSTVIETDEKDEDSGDAGLVKLEWCNWGAQMVPCAPGFGGAWYQSGHREPDRGIWPKVQGEGHGPDSKTVEVYAGNRDETYLPGQ